MSSVLHSSLSERHSKCLKYMLNHFLMSKFTFIMHLKSTNIEISLKGPIWKGQSKSQKVISTKRFGQKLRNSSFRETKI